MGREEVHSVIGRVRAGFLNPEGYGRPVGTNLDAVIIATQPIHHGAPALSELAATIGYLDPLDSRTVANLKPVIETLERVPPQMILMPSEWAWIEASILSGILARTQGIPKADRRRLLNDALLFLMAAETDATLISRNLRDFDLLLQMKPGVRMLNPRRQFGSRAGSRRGKPNRGALRSYIDVLTTL